MSLSSLFDLIPLPPSPQLQLARKNIAELQEEKATLYSLIAAVQYACDQLGVRWEPGPGNPYICPPGSEIPYPTYKELYRAAIGGERTANQNADDLMQTIREQQAALGEDQQRLLDYAARIDDLETLLSELADAKSIASVRATVLRWKTAHVSMPELGSSREGLSGGG